MVTILGSSLLFALLKRSANGYVRESAILILSLCLFIISPISIWMDDPHMTGYVNPTIWHSPTYNALRLFIVPVSLLSLRIVDGSRYRDVNQRIFFLLLTASLISLATLAKPSNLIALIPGLCLLVAYRVVKSQPVDWALLFLGIILPGAVLLALQYLITYEDGGGIQFGLFTLLRLWLPIWQIPIRLILSLAFPLSVYVLYFSEARKHTYLNMSWLIFFVGLGYMYFLTENSWRFYHSNFNWTAYSVIFALMYASVQFLVERRVAERRRKLQDGHGTRGRLSMRFAVVASLFGLHVIFGIIYFFRFQLFPV